MSIEDDAVETLCEVLKKNTTLTHLKIGRVHHSHAAPSMLTKDVINCKLFLMTDMDFDDDEQLNSFCEALQANTTLFILDLKSLQ